MEEQNSKIKITYLLKRKRFGEHAELVKVVIGSEASLEEKIKNIEELDNRYFNNELDEEIISKRENAQLIKRKKIITPEIAARILRRIKRHNFRRPVLFHLVGHKKLIKNFNIDTGILRTGFFPRTMRIKKKVFNSLIDIRQTAQKLLPIIIGMQKASWAYLDKKDYNLVAAFRKLCENIIMCDFEGFDYSDKHIVRHLIDIEELYYVCHYLPEYPQTIIGSISEVFSKYPKYANKIDGILAMVERILLEPVGKLSLGNILRAMNIVEYHRYFELRDLIRNDFEDSVNTFDFNCGAEIQFRINRTIDEYLAKLKGLLGLKQESDKIKHYLTQYLNENGNEYNYAPLKQFYKEGGIDKNLKFIADSKNISVFASNFYRIFMQQFWQFLIGDVDIEGKGKTKLFDKDFFGTDFTQLRRLTEQFEEAFFKQHNFARDRFIALKNNSKIKPSPTEANILKIIDDLSGTLLHIGKKLATLSAIHRESGLPENYQPLTVEMLDNSFIDISIWNMRINDKGMLSKKTFRQVIDKIVTLCFLSGIYFYDSDFQLLLSKGKYLNKKINKVMSILEHFCDVVTYEKIRRKYNIVYIPDDE